MNQHLNLVPVSERDETIQTKLMLLLCPSRGKSRGGTYFSRSDSLSAKFSTCTCGDISTCGGPISMVPLMRSC
jgi:hypothetical protein